MADRTRFDTHVTAERFELLVNSVTDYAIYMLDSDGYVATWNPGARRFKGYEAEEIIGRNFSTFFTPRTARPECPSGRSGSPPKRAASRPRAGGCARTAPASGSTPCSTRSATTTGKLLGFAKITRDDHRQAGRRARPAGERAALPDCSSRASSDYALYMLDPDGRVTNWNTGAEAIKGYKADEIVGQHFSRFYTEEDRAAGEPARALATALAEGKYENEAWRVRKDGTRFWANVVIDPIHDEQGRLIGFAKITRDITERRRAQEELEEARGRPVPVPEASGAGRADRRGRPRFQQSDDGHPRLGRSAAGGPA